MALSGLAWGRVFGIGARFGIYEVLTAFYKDGREDNYVYVSEALMAGMAAGAVVLLTSLPFELLKLRAQVTSASRISRTPVTESKAVVPAIARLLRVYTPDMKTLNHSVGTLSILNSKHPNMVGAIQEYPWMMSGSGRPPSVYDVRRPSEIISLEGWGALWRGLCLGVARDSVFGGIFFSTWQLLHRALLDCKAIGMDPHPGAFLSFFLSIWRLEFPLLNVFSWLYASNSKPLFSLCFTLHVKENREKDPEPNMAKKYDEEIGPLSPLAVSLAAGFSSSVAAAASQGFDTAKSRSQCIVLPKFISMERKLLKWKIPGKRFERITGIHPADRNLLFRGIWLRMARSGIASFVTNINPHRLH